MLQTTDRQTEGRRHISKVNSCSRSLKRSGRSWTEGRRGEMNRGEVGNDESGIPEKMEKKKRSSDLRVV